jgi:hypothetical protein
MFFISCCVLHLVEKFFRVLMEINLNAQSYRNRLQVTKFVVPQAKAKEKQVYKADTCSINTHERKRRPSGSSLYCK